MCNINLETTQTFCIFAIGKQTKKEKRFVYIMFLYLQNHDESYLQHIPQTNMRRITLNMYYMNTELKQFILQRIIRHKSYNEKVHNGFTISIQDFKNSFNYEYQKSVVILQIKNAIISLRREKIIKDLSEVIVYNDGRNGKIYIDLK